MSERTTGIEYRTPTPPGGAGVYSQRVFLVVVAVLTLAAAGLNGAVQFMQLHFKKQPVPMRQTFAKAIPQVMGPWVRVTNQETIDADVLHVLGTDKFMICSYVDTSKFGKSPEQILALFAGRTFDEQRNELFQLTVANPAAVLALNLTYYTGKADTVAHIPERCYVGDGYSTEQAGYASWTIGDQTLPVRSLKFARDTGRRPIPCNVAYFFHVNGRYEADSLKVRAELQNLFRRYGYYAKFEMRCDTDDRAAAEESMRSFMAVARPAFESAMPVWSEYSAKR
jgi:Protein of unknown function (DUF3485)